MIEQTTRLAYEDAVLLLADGTRIPVTGDLAIAHDVERARTDRAVLPDENWTFTDPAGHTHTYVRDDEDVPRLPSLERGTRHVDCDGSCFSGGDCDGYDETVWSCRECGVEVEPGFMPDAYARDVGIVMYETIEYSLAAEFPPPKGKRSWRRPLTRTITMRATDPPLVGPIEGAAYAWVDPERGDCRFPLPTLHAHDTDFQIEGGRLVLAVQLHGSEMRDVERKPTGP